MKQSIIAKIKSAPKVPGVYIFYGKNAGPRWSSGNNSVLYIGKAANLRARLNSYLKITDAKTQSLNEETIRLEYIPLRSEIEALIEESRLIQKLKPKYNVIWQDDKSYLYIYFTKEFFPKIFVGHEKPRRSMNYDSNRIGPFTDGNALRTVIKFLRRYFPYCTCFNPHFRDCLNTEIGLCLGICCKKESALTRQSTALESGYKHNIKMIKAVLHGQSKKLLKTLKSPGERWALEKIFEHKEFLATGKPGARSQMPAAIKKVECYDNSHLAGKEAVGALTALVKKDGFWVSDKNSYRKFKIKSAPTNDDPRMIYETVSRRLKHPEWPYPDLIIIDGGITQYNAARKALNEVGLAEKIKLVSFAKPNRQVIGWTNPPEGTRKLIEQAIYQTHNFVIRYHRQVRAKEFLK